eukprot:gene28945-32137_t
MAACTLSRVDEALALLTILLSDSNDNQLQAAQAGIIPVLIQVNEAMALLTILLSDSNDNQLQAAQAGIIPVLIQVSVQVDLPVNCAAPSCAP